ncbi:hypothetical protein HCR_17320 [Hydrogenimonas cancrithermarum]|uniref:Acetoacetyl-CoA synthase n=2 Tax=Hydrogenimonas cancrithermarum TaxID=2993563 RepID=A0ABN6WWC9_9BACT|nr:hypothetical protein HCR_17320 [Hydrogenimonas cancrithermarum]
MMRITTITLEASSTNTHCETASISHLSDTQKEKRRKEWLKSDQSAIEAYNRHIETNGLFGEEYRTF